MGFPLVSIITPCFNGASYVRRFLESVLAQSYSAMELIFVNDGSTDETEAIVLEYVPRFRQRQIVLVYLSQENQGQAAAMNLGLQVFRGDYITWMDSDDYLRADAVEKRVDFLESNPRYGLVRCEVNVVSEADPGRVRRKLYRMQARKREEWIFERMLLEQNMYAMNGSFLVRSSALLDVLPERRIYASRAGQNWQLLLPLLHRYRCGYLDDALFYLVERTDSHSRSLDTQRMDQVFSRYDSLEDVLRNTVNRMELDREHYHRMITVKYERMKLFAAIRFREYAVACRHYEELRKMNGIRLSDRLVFRFRKQRGVVGMIVKARKLLWHAGFYGV